MSIRLTGGGRGDIAEVSRRNRLLVDAQTSLAGHFVSAIDHLAFNVVSIDAGAAANDYIFYFKNDSTDRLFFVDLIRVHAVNAARWKVAEVTGTATGTTITPVNLDLTSGVTAEATALGNDAVGGLTESAVIAVDRTVAAGSTIIPFDDMLILGANDAIAVEYDTGTTGIAEVLMRGYYKKLSEIGGT